MSRIISASELKAAGIEEIFPNHMAFDQESDGMVVLREAPGAVPTKGPAFERSFSENDGQGAVASPITVALKTQKILSRTGPQISRLFARAGLRRYAPLTEAAKNARHTAGRSAVLSRRPARRYDVLRNAHRQTPALEMPTSSAPTKIISLKQLRRIADVAVSEFLPVPALAARPLAAFAAKRLLHAPGMR